MDHLTPKHKFLYASEVNLQMENNHMTNLTVKTTIPAKIVRRRPTMPPYECEHCGLIWYGTRFSHWSMRDMRDVPLCSRCWKGLDTYIDAKYDDFLFSVRDTYTDEERDTIGRKIQEGALAWIQNKRKKPLPLSPEKRFHQGVPCWLRNAIIAGAVKTNDKQVYTVFSQGIEFVRVEVVPSFVEAKDKLRNLVKARRLIRSWSKPTPRNHYNKGWEGVAPSYLCTELDIDYDEAGAILKDLEEEGFIYDNGHGNHNTLPDGRTYATRYFMTAIAESKGSDGRCQQR